MENTNLPVPTSTKLQHRQTGPRSLVGKANSSLNAIKHGMNTTDKVLMLALKPREQEVLNKYRRSIYRYYRPRTFLEKLQADRIAIHYLRMMRVTQYESLALYVFPLKQVSNSIMPHLDRFSRFDVRIEKQIRILHNRLIMMIENRGSNIPKLIPTNE